MNMTNFEVLRTELKGLQGYEPNELELYLYNNDLVGSEAYDKMNRIGILQTTIDVLSSMANNQSYFADKQHEDMSISGFGEVLQNRIDQAETQLRKLKAEKNNSSTFFLFNS
ncbi:hypothetical protein [Halobacillus amylolyticus]|uniref:Uncharacterized protein n=1 Tax=Halobacillus amylolyticus TaxID=2932259 RepID=A0ABY4HBB2_9BACI|nr:hypothetical protein [Halobacillus amylolyticus]UOR12191.1 hypothetical protein MUO15_01235 [Halobacillus amylolyticus]